MRNLIYYHNNKLLKLAYFSNNILLFGLESLC